MSRSDRVITVPEAQWDFDADKVQQLLHGFREAAQKFEATLDGEDKSRMYVYLIAATSSMLMKIAVVNNIEPSLLFAGLAADYSDTRAEFEATFGDGTEPRH